MARAEQCIIGADKAAPNIYMDDLAELGGGRKADIRKEEPWPVSVRLQEAECGLRNQHIIVKETDVLCCNKMGILPEVKEGTGFAEAIML